MNSFIEHPVLKDMPYGEMKNPSISGIQSFLKSKRKKQRQLSLAYAIFGLIIFIGVLLTVESGLAQYLIVFSSFSIMYRGVLFFKSAKKYDMTNEKIETLIEASISDDIDVQ